MRSMKNNYSKKVIDVIEYSREEAARLQNSYIGPEHLMLGLLREGNGNAVSILQEMNADLTQIKKEMNTKYEIRMKRAKCRSTISASAKVRNMYCA